MIVILLDATFGSSYFSDTTLAAYCKISFGGAGKGVSQVCRKALRQIDCAYVVDSECRCDTWCIGEDCQTPLCVFSEDLPCLGFL
jgi:hypothetical protein